MHLVLVAQAHTANESTHLGARCSGARRGGQCGVTRGEQRAADHHARGREQRRWQWLVEQQLSPCRGVERRQRKKRLRVGGGHEGLPGMLRRYARLGLLREGETPESMLEEAEEACRVSCELL